MSAHLALYAASPRIARSYSSHNRCSNNINSIGNGDTTCALPSSQRARNNTPVARLRMSIAAEEAIVHTLTGKLARLQQQQQQQQQQQPRVRVRDASASRPAKYEHTLLQCAKTHLRNTLHADNWHEVVATVQPSASLQRVCHLVSTLLTCSSSDAPRAWTHVQGLVAAPDVLHTVDRLDAQALPRDVVEYVAVQLRDAHTCGDNTARVRTREGRCVAAWHRWVAALLAFQQARYGMSVDMAVDGGKNSSSSSSSTSSRGANNGHGNTASSALELCAARIAKATQRKEQLLQQLRELTASGARDALHERSGNNHCSDGVRAWPLRVSVDDVTTTTLTRSRDGVDGTRSRRVGEHDDDKGDTARDGLAMDSGTTYMLGDGGSVANGASTRTDAAMSATTQATTNRTAATSMASTSFAVHSSPACERAMSEASVRADVVSSAAVAATQTCAHCQAMQQTVAELQRANAQLHEAHAAQVCDTAALRDAAAHAARQLCDVRADVHALHSVHATVLHDYDEVLRERDELTQLCRELLQRIASREAALSDTRQRAATARQEALLCKAVVCVLRAQNEALRRAAAA